MLDNAQQDDLDVFWGEMAPSEHFLQIYEDDRVLLDTLEGFIGGGIRSGDSAIVIASDVHRTSLANRLIASGIDLRAAEACDQYIALDAAETLSQFMVKGLPDADLFTRVVMDIMGRAAVSGRRVRAFGEMVAILWDRGDYTATVQLEHLWHNIVEGMGFPLFCAYPRPGITQDAEVSIRQICAAHSKFVPGSWRPSPTGAR